VARYSFTADVNIENDLITNNVIGR